MKKYILSKYLVLALVLSFIPSMAFAANIYFETTKNVVSAGDTFIVTAKIDAEDVDLNSVDGSIVLDSKENNFVVNDFSLAKSIFSLWPRTPSLSKEGNVISFVGGVPGGFKFNKAILFNIVVETNKEGNIKISPKDMAVFANDGKGTRVPVTLGTLDIKVTPKIEGNAVENEWSSLVASDKTNPEDFAVLIGKEASLFEGKRFAFFTAVDNQSGISYYEVSEDEKPAIRSGSMYVLQNQDENKDINLKVTAYDKAGNKTTAVYKNPGFTIFGFSLNFIIVLVVIIIGWFVFKRIKKIRKNRKNVSQNQ